MSAPWKTVRVFISSTFRDMHAERDYLVKVVFPTLRAELEKYRIHLVDIDLRWGVTTKQADNDQALELCLQQIDACRPLFIGILGERYGWVPNLLPDFQKPEYGWVQGMTGKSITELEILHGVLNDQEMRSRAFFYFRDKSFINDVPLAKRADVLAENDEAVAKLAFLKERIRGADLPSPPFEYSCRYRGLKLNWRLVRSKLNKVDQEALHDIAIDGIVDNREYEKLTPHLREIVDKQGTIDLDGLQDFGRQIETQILEAIKIEHELPDIPPTISLAETDPLAAEADHHERFMKSRLRIYVGRENIQRTLTEYADSDNTVPCLLTGPSGSGKSAALAKFVTDYRENHPEVLVVPHFVGASPTSTSLPQLLRRFCLILNEEFHLLETAVHEKQKVSGISTEIPQEINILTTTFLEFLGRIPNDQRVVMVIDALNQLDETDNAQTLNWLPQKCAPHVKLIGSCIDDIDRDEEVLNTFRRRQQREELTIQPLTNEERFEIIQQVPSLSAKALDGKQIQLLLSNPATTNPLFLLVALEELRCFGSFELLNTRIVNFPTGAEATTELFIQIIERLEEDFGGSITKKVLSMLACARRGLSESELLDLTRGLDQNRSFFAVLRQLRPYLQPRGELFDFFHRNLFKAVRQMYLRDDHSKQAAHRELAGYFDNQPLKVGSGDKEQPNFRKVDELPWQRIRAEDWDGIERELCDLQFVEMKCLARLTWDLVADYATALKLLPQFQHERAQEQQRQKNLCKYRDDLIAYAHVRGKGVPLPKPPDSRDSQVSMRQAEAASIQLMNPFSERSPGAQIKNFSNFVYSHSHVLDRFPHETLPFAFNHASDGPVVEQARALLDARNPTWLRRANRPPIPPENPIYLQTLKGHTDTVNAVALTFAGDTAISASADKTLRVWDATTGEPLRTLQGHTASVYAVAMSPDGHTAVSGGADKTLRVWDVASGELLQTLQGHTDHIIAVAMTPDGHTALSTGADKTLRVWDIATGQLRWTLQGHTNSVNSVAITPNGDTALSGSSDQTLRIWNLITGELLRTLQGEGHTDIVKTVELTPDGRTAVSAGDDQTLRVWDVVTGELLRVLQGHNDWVNAVAIMPDGHTVISASRDQTLRVWNITSGRLLRTLKGHTDTVNTVVLLPDGHSALSTSEDRTVRVWDVASGELLQILQGQQNTDWVKSVAITPDGHTAVSAPSRGDITLHVWDFTSGELLRRLKGHNDWVNSVVLTPDGHTAISASADKTLRVWDVTTGELLRTLQGHTASVNAVAITPDGHTAVSAGDDNTLRVWDVGSGELLRTLHGHTGSVSSVAITPDGHTAVSASWDQTLHVWDIASGKFLRRLYGEGHNSSVNAVALTPDGHTALSAGDNTLLAWDIINGKLLQTLEAHHDRISAVALTPDGHTAVSASWDQTIRAWDIISGGLMRTLQGDAHIDSINAIALTPDGHTAVSAGEDKTLRVWNIASGLPSWKNQREGHTDRINAVALTLDGNTAISASEDKTLRVWDVTTGEPLRTLQGHTDQIDAVAITPDGHTALSAGSDILCAWDVATGKPLWKLDINGFHMHMALTPNGSTAVYANDDNTLEVWNIATSEIWQIIQGHTGSVNAVALTPDGQTAVCANMSQSFRMWDVTTGKRVRTPEFPETVNAVALTPDGRTAVSAGEDNSLRVWDIATGKLLRTFQVEEHTDTINAIVLTPNRHTAISCSWDQTLRAWDVATGNLLWTACTNCDNYAVAITIDGLIAVSAGEDWILRVWDVTTGQLLRTLQGHTDSVSAVALTPDGRTAVSGSWDETLRVWDVATGQLRWTLEAHQDRVSAVAITPDGRTAISTSLEEPLHVWDVATGKHLRSLFGQGPNVSLISAMALTSDGHTVVSASRDHSLRVWDVASGELLRRLKGHTSGVIAVALTPDSRTAVSISLDETLRVWDVASGDHLRAHQVHILDTPPTNVVVTADNRVIVDTISGQLHFFTLVNYP